MNPDQPQSYEFLEYCRIAERAFASAASSYVAEDLQLMDEAREAEFDTRVADLASLFLDLSDVPESQWGSREAAVSRGLYEALTNPDVGVMVQAIADDLVKPELEEVEEALRRAGLTPERLAELSAEHDPSADPDPDHSRHLGHGPASTSYGLSF